MCGLIRVVDMLRAMLSDRKFDSRRFISVREALSGLTWRSEKVGMKKNRYTAYTARRDSPRDLTKISALLALMW